MAKKKPWLETPQEFGEWDTSVTDGSVGPPPPADVADDAVDDPDQVGVEAAPEPTLPDPTPTPVPVLDVDEIESTNRPDVTAEVELPTGETILGPTIVVRGRMRSSEDLVVHGRIEAAVHSTRDLRLESTGVVNADLDVRAVWVSGIVVGDIRATDRVELGPQARVIGDIRTPRLIIHDGAKFRGTIEMDGLQALEIVRPSRPTPAPPPPAPEPPRVVPNAPTVLRDVDTPEPPPPPVAVIRPAAPRYEPDPPPPKLEPAPPPPIATVAPSRPAPTPPPARPAEKPPEKLSPGNGGWFGRRS